MIPEGVESFSIPSLEVDLAVALHGRIIDASGKPVPRAVIVGVYRENSNPFFDGITPAGVANNEGEFRLAGQNHSARPNQRATLVVRLANGREFEIPVRPTLDGTVTVQLPE